MISMYSLLLKFIYILIFLSIPILAYSEEWVLITEMDGRKHYMDSSSIRESSGFKWARHKSQYSSVQKGEDYANKKTYKYITTNSQLAFNCEAKTLTPVTTYYFDDNGNKVHEISFTTEQKVIEGDKQWELDNNPDTFRASIIEYVCK